jgi:hypothetical protein
MTGFFASDLRPLASEPSIDAVSSVRRTIAHLHPHQMQEIKVRFNPDDLTALDQQAAASGTSRSAFIRNKALSLPVARLTTVEYHALVADAVSAMRGDLPRLQVEYLVAYVITRLDQHHRQTDAGHQPAA